MARMGTIIIKKSFKFQVSSCFKQTQPETWNQQTNQGALAPFFMTKTIQIVPASQGDMPQIIHGIKQLMLDDIDLKREQFAVAKHNDSIIGFGRIRNYPDALEICSVGVLQEERNRGVGDLLVQELIKRAKGAPIYVVCIIPEFFKRFGFKETAVYPDSLKPKLEYCKGTLGGCEEGQEYVVMKR